jgi:hypothetical protein
MLIEEIRNLNAYVQSAAQQLIQPEPNKLDFHSRGLDAWLDISGRVNSGVRR